jgi:pyruvate carboxylase subunit A
LCEKAGIKFVGPTSKAMDAMGDKVSAKRNAIAAGVPVAPASEGAVHANDARAVAERIGLPVIVKAVHGGGGMGMRVVRSMDELDKAVRDASAQAASAFGSDEVFIEKFIDDPRHIEFQILGDEHGNVVHLGERECSIQRRNQKLLEEAPSPAITPEQRREIGERCVKLAKSVGYSAAGTMEFLYKDHHFYFMEMNTRLQVEHPVTELVTGVDVVKWQLKVCSGERLTIAQDDVKLRGHALELRINAEDAYNQFAPAPGLVKRLRRPAGPGIRVDDGIEEGFVIPSTYDSLVMKLVTYAEDRTSTIERAQRALDELEIGGELKTNVPFHRAVLRHPAFQKGDMNTGFIRIHQIMESLEVEAKAAARERRVRAAAIAAALTRAPGGGIRGVHYRQNAPKPLPARENAPPAWALRRRL